MFPTIYISETIQIPTYFLVISLVICICLVWLKVRAVQKNLDSKLSLDIALILMITALIGARGMHVLYENYDYYSKNPLAIFYLHQGGFVFYGGAILATICGWLYAKLKRPNLIPALFDLYAPIASLAYGLGRIGCFLAGCCYGKYCDLPWAVDGRHPTQLYAVFWELGVLLILLGFEKRKHQAGQVFSLWITLHAFGRILMENYRDDFRGPSFGISISTAISLLLIICGIFFFFRKPTSRRPAI